MQRALLVIAAAVAVVTAIVLVTGGVSDDSKSSEERVEEIQQRYAGARACMPPAQRRRLSRIQNELDARNPDSAAAAELAVQAETLIGPYVPGGDRYDQQCYDAAWERFKRRFAQQE